MFGMSRVMPNIREQRVDLNGIYIKASDGREITLTRGQIHALTNPHLPDKAVARMKVMQAIENALGAEQVPVDLIEFDFDESDGRPIRLEIG